MQIALYSYSSVCIWYLQVTTTVHVPRVDLLHVFKSWLITISPRRIFLHICSKIKFLKVFKGNTGCKVVILLQIVCVCGAFYFVCMCVFSLMCCIYMCIQVVQCHVFLCLLVCVTRACCLSCGWFVPHITRYTHSVNVYYSRNGKQWMFTVKIEAKTCVLCVNNKLPSRHSAYCFYSIATFIEKRLTLYSQQSPHQEFSYIHDNKQ